MNDRGETPLPEDHRDIDPGEPIPQLSRIQQAPSSGFSTTLRKKISRRVTAVQVVNFSWEIPKVLFIEIIEFVAFLFGARDNQKGSRL